MDAIYPRGHKKMHSEAITKRRSYLSIIVAITAYTKRDGVPVYGSQIIGRGGEFLNLVFIFQGTSCVHVNMPQNDTTDFLLCFYLSSLH